MHVVATAGHVDHGKSTLVRALTGMEPDRWAEEQRRGMTIDLGFAWTGLPDGGQVAFVDVPGHERFVPTMLAGVGPVPAVLLVVAADEGWMPQTAEHVDALDALGVEHGLLVVTRSDLADPDLAAEEAAVHLAGTSLAGLEAVAVSATTGAGLDHLVARLSALVGRLPAPDPQAPVRLWVDRAFTVRGSGTVVTGTLPAGRLRTGDELTVHGSARGPRGVRVRGLQSLGAAVPEAYGVARVAVNLRGVDREELARGDALLTPGLTAPTAVVDVRVESRHGPPEGLDPRAALVLHVGSASVPVRVRPLQHPAAGAATDAPAAAPAPGTAVGPDGRGRAHARLTLARPLPLVAGDVALLRDPAARRVVGRVLVLDTAPPPLLRRGAGAARARDLQQAQQTPDGDRLLRARGTLRVHELRAVGATAPRDAVRVGEWFVDPGLAEDLAGRLMAAVAEHRASGSLDPGPTVEAARVLLDLPDRAVLPAVLRPPLAVRDGRVVDVTAPPPLPAAVARAVDALRAELADRPFAAPEAGRLAELGLGARELAAAERAGAVLRVADGVVLLPTAAGEAARVLGALDQPFTLSQARQALGTTRRVAVPLLELLDRRRLTVRLPDDRREVRGQP